MINLDQIKRLIARRLALSDVALDRRIIVVGDSHVSAFEQAVSFKGNATYSQVEVYLFEKTKGDISIGNISLTLPFVLQLKLFKD